MEEKNKLNITEEELNELKHELEMFQQEKEKVRAIIGRIGGVPTGNEKILNFVFFIIIIFCLLISFLAEGKIRYIMSEIAIALISFKIMYLIHIQAKVNHFQLWILSSIEWRVNEFVRKLEKIEKQIANK